MASDNLPMAVSAATYMADQLVKQGRLHEAHDGYLEALRLAISPNSELIPAAGLPYVKLGDLVREWNELSSARGFLSKGISLCQKWGHSDSLVIGYVTLSRISLAEGDKQSATVAFQKAADLVQRTAIDPWTECLVDELRLRLWLAEGKLPAAQQWVADAGLKSDDEIDFLRDIEHINLLRLLVALGSQHLEKAHLHEALDLGDRLLDKTEKVGWIGKSIVILILQALAYQALNQVGKALVSLRRALRLAKPGGYISVFADEGVRLEKLLESVGAHDSEGEYVLNLLRACRERKERVTAPLARPVTGPAGKMISPAEALSEREMEVLRLLNSSLTVPEIARELYIAVSTTRTHIRNIYGKLDVHGRIEAIQRAQDLNLI